MKLKKYLLLILAILPLVGCQVNQENKEKETMLPKELLVNDEAKASLKVINKVPGETIIRYEIKNMTTKLITYSFKSGQKYEYIITDSKGRKIVKYSEQHMFTQAFTQQVIKPKKTWVQDLLIRNLKPGKYNLTVWLTEKDTKELHKQSISFEVE